jgi:short-subunit dehydrogenase
MAACGTFETRRRAQMMIRAFAPVLARNGGGTIANMLSIVSRFVYPFNGTYCASKHAALAVSDAARIPLKSQAPM